MTDSFLLLVFPMRSLTIHLGGYRDCMGLSLRGGCTTAVDATHLEQAMEQWSAEDVQTFANLFRRFVQAVEARPDDGTSAL